MEEGGLRGAHRGPQVYQSSYCYVSPSLNKGPLPFFTLHLHYYKITKLQMTNFKFYILHILQTKRTTVHIHN